MQVWPLAWPILIEQFLRIMFMNVDVIMIGYYSSKAVAAVGPVTTMTFFVMILYAIVGNGAGIVISQHLGADKPREAGDTALAAMNMMLLLGVVLSVILSLSTDVIMNMFGFTDTVKGFAKEYWVIFALTSLTQASNIAFSAILRSYGYAKLPMLINMGANVFNVFGNYVFIFGAFGMPVLGVTGVALSTSIARGIGAVVMIIFIFNMKDIWLPFKDIARIPKSIYSSILKIGGPTAAEMLSYNTAQLFMIRIVASFGTAPLAAMTYTQNIGRFIFVCSQSLGAAGQILAGYLVGGGRYDEAQRRVRRVFYIAFIVSVSIATVVAIFRYPLISLLTKDPEVISLIALLLLIQIPLEAGRSFNLVFINAMKGAGDVKYPVVIGVLSMWGIGVCFALIFGHVLGWGLAGVWWGITCDESFRGIFSAARWNTGRWYKKKLMKGAL